MALTLALLLASCDAPEPGVDRRLGQAAALAASCSGCHSTGGSAMTDLSSMSEKAIVTGFLAYRQDQEGSSVMHRIARGYSEQDIRLIARQLARQE